MKPSVCWSVLNKSSQFLFYRMCMYVSVHKRRFSECVRDFDFKLWHQYLPSFQKESLSQYLWSWWNTKSKRSLQTTHFKPDQSITGKQIVFFPPLNLFLHLIECVTEHFSFSVSGPDVCAAVCADDVRGVESEFSLAVWWSLDSARDPQIQRRAAGCSENHTTNTENCMPI